MEQIGRYQILGELGRGAMGLVYKAQDPTIGRTIAIKSIRLLDLTSDGERERLRERLVREAQSAGVLSHPGIVTIYDIAEENGTAYIFMEFVPGQPLEKMLLAAQPPDGETMLSIFRQTAAALDYAHRNGIVHRDIKPANIMIHEDGSAKITDFGVAKIMSQQMTQAGTMMGTPSYMSPEQVQGIAVDGRADQFALAVIAYEVLTGEKPFAAEYLPTLLYKIVREDPVPASRLNSTLTPAVEAVLGKALAKLPEDRYGTCSEFIAALSAACNASKGWVPLPRGATHELPTVGSGERNPARSTAGTSGGSTWGTPGRGLSQSASRFDTSETVADEVAPGAIDTPAPPPMPATHPSSPSAPVSIPIASAALPEPPALPELPVVSTPVSHSRQAPSQPSPEALMMPRMAPLTVERRLGNDPLAGDNGSNHSVRNVILAAALVALASVGAFIGVQRYEAAQPTAQPAAQPPAVPTANSSPPAIPPPAVAAPTPADANATAAAPDEPKPPETHPPETSAVAAAEAAPPAPAVPPAIKTTPQARPAAIATSFQLTTSPSGTTAIFDGDPGMQCVAPCKITLSSGRHTISLHHAGYRDAQRIIEIPRDPGLIVDLTATSGTLSLSSNPPGLMVAIDGQEQARRTPLSVNLPVGRHRVDVLKGNDRQTMTVDIQDGEISSKFIDWSQ